MPTDVLRLAHIDATTLRELLAKRPDLIGTTQTVWVPASSRIDMLIKGNIDPSLEENLRLDCE